MYIILCVQSYVLGITIRILIVLSYSQYRITRIEMYIILCVQSYVLGIIVRILVLLSYSQY